MTIRILLPAFALLLVLSVPVEAQTAQPQSLDCRTEVQAQRQAAEAAGTPMTRDETLTAIADCIGRELELRVADQERVIAALNAEIAALGLRVDDNQRILDANNQVIGFIKEIDGQLAIIKALNAEAERLNAEIERLNASSERMLAEAERILMRLATQ